MKVRRIDTREGFEALAPVWQSVATESGQTSPFLSHEWFGCCWGAAPNRGAHLTNPVESLNARYRRAVKGPGIPRPSRVSSRCG